MWPTWTWPDEAHTLGTVGSKLTGRLRTVFGDRAEDKYSD